MNTVNSLQQAANQLSFHSSGPFRELSAVIRQNLFKKDYQGAIEAIRREYSRLSKEPGRNGQKELLNMLGIDNLPFMRMLKLTDAEYAETNKKAQEFGVLTEKATQSLRSMEISLSTIRQALKAVSYPVLEKLAPVLDKISAGMERVAFLSPEVKTGIVGILGAVTLLSPALRTAGFLFGSVFSFSTVGITAAAGAAYLLWQNWDKVSQAFKDYLSESPRLKDALEVVGEGFRAIGNGIKWLADNFNSWFPYFIDGINEILTFPKWLRTMADGSLIMDLTIDGEVQFYGRRCINRMPLMLSQVISGNFYFYDLYGNSDPEYSGFNSRYQLIYDTDFNLQ